MNILSFLMLIFWIFSNLSIAAETVPSGLTITSHLENLKLHLVVNPSPGHHFNVKAPMSLSIQSKQNRLAPQKKDTSQIQFIIPAPKAAENYEVRLYICDDANTYCRLKVLHTKWDEKKSQLIQE